MDHHEKIEYPVLSAIAISYSDDGEGDVKLQISTDLSPVQLMTAINHATVIVTRKLSEYMDEVVKGDCYCKQCQEVRTFWTNFQRIRQQAKNN